MRHIRDSPLSRGSVAFTKTASLNDCEKRMRKREYNRLLQDNNLGGPLPRQDVRRDVVAIPVHSDIRPRFAQPHVPNDNFIEKVRHGEIAKADFIVFVHDLETQAGRE
jgi:hypothetical protein